MNLFRPLAVLALIGITIPTSIEAQRPTDRPPRGGNRAAPGMAMARIAQQNPGQLISQLDLSQDQAGQISTLITTFRSEHQDALNRLQQMQQAMREARQGEMNRQGSDSGGRPSRGGNRASMQNLSAQHGNPMQELQEPLAKLSTDITALLTPQQQERFREMQRAVPQPNR